MEVKPLSTIPFQELIDCFNLAFDGYFVKMPTEASYYKQRWSAAKVNYDLSFGMFDKNKLIGFIINAIDLRQNKLIAYNTGTGVIPTYRGKKIVKQIYDFALPLLKKHKISTYTLEVITNNIKAIKAYESIGFTIVKSYTCFSGKIEVKQKESAILKKVKASEFNWELSKKEQLYSWDNQKEAVSRNNAYTYFYIKHNQNKIGYCIINLSNGYISQIEAFSDLEEDYKIILRKIGNLCNQLKINNVDETLENKISALENLGFKNSINQYEMKLDY